MGPVTHRRSDPIVLASQSDPGLLQGEMVAQQMSRRHDSQGMYHGHGLLDLVQISGYNGARRLGYARFAVARQIHPSQMTHASICVDKVPPMKVSLSTRPGCRPIVREGVSLFLGVLRGYEDERSV